MNERFAELAEEAKKFARAQMNHPMDPMIFSAAVFQEKFAELIVRECMSVVEDFTIEIEVGLDDYQEYEASEVLKEHFGVE